MDKHTYIALLRGINVAGQKSIKMADLKVLAEQVGYQNVRTYIQSGNIVFESQQGNAEELAQHLKSGIMGKYGFDVGVMVLAADDFNHILQSNPYQNQKLSEGENLYFTILGDIPLPEHVAALLREKDGIDDFTVIGKAVYILCRKGYGTSKFSNTFVEKKLKVSATTRNEATMKKLMEMAKVG